MRSMQGPSLVTPRTKPHPLWELALGESHSSMFSSFHLAFSPSIVTGDLGHHLPFELSIVHTVKPGGKY